MSTRKIETEAELDAFIESGDISDGVLVRESGGFLWLVYDTEDGPYAVRPPHEDDNQPYTPPLVEFDEFRLPLYVTVEEF